MRKVKIVTQKASYRNVRDLVNTKMEELFAEVILNFGLKKPDFPREEQDSYEEHANGLAEVMLDYVKHNKK